LNKPLVNHPSLSKAGRRFGWESGSGRLELPTVVQLVLGGSLLVQTSFGKLQKALE